MQHNEDVGTRLDLCKYRLEIARKDVESAKVLLGIDDCKETLEYVKTIMNNYKNLRVLMMDSICFMWPVFKIKVKLFLPGTSCPSLILQQRVQVLSPGL